MPKWSIGVGATIVGPPGRSVNKSGFIYLRPSAAADFRATGMWVSEIRPMCTALGYQGVQDATYSLTAQHVLSYIAQTE